MPISILFCNVGNLSCPRAVYDIFVHLICRNPFDCSNTHSWQANQAYSANELRRSESICDDNDDRQRDLLQS